MSQGEKGKRERGEREREKKKKNPAVAFRAIARTADLSSFFRRKKATGQTRWYSVLVKYVFQQVSGRCTHCSAARTAAPPAASGSWGASSLPVSCSEIFFKSALLSCLRTAYPDGMRGRAFPLTA